MHTRRSSALPVAVTALVASLAGCLPSTNVYDPSGPPDTLALTFVTGQLAFDDGAPLDGVAVDIYRESEGEERVTATFEAGDGRDAFSFEVAPDVTRVVIRPGRCGYADVTIDIPDEYPEYAANLTPGSEFDVGDGRPVVLRRDPPSRTLTGRVEVLDEATSASGVKVSLVEVDNDDTCRTTVAEVTTESDGTFSVGPIADGRYVAVAFTEGTTVAISDVVDSCASEALDDGALPVVELPLLSIRAGTSALTLAPTMSDAPDLPPGVIAEPRVNVVVGDFFDWADEMRLSEDPTFASGSTGWVPIESPRLYPSVGELRGDTDTTVFGQFRSACGLSPLYSASVTYDGQPPDVFRVRLKDVEVEPDPLGGSRGTDTVTVETDAAVTLAVDGFDETGAVITVDLTPRQVGADAPEQVSFTATSGGGFSFREQIAVPLDEGIYDVLVTVADAAGNLAATGPFSFDVIRDSEPPTTPLPSVTELEVASSVAYIWLEERDCVRPLPDGSSEDYRAFICEENPREFSFFEVRGGPVLLDFTGFDQPPFAIPLIDDEEIEVEIRAVDLAGNASESVGRVTVVRRTERELLELPIEATLGPVGTPTLAATNGTAIFGLSPHAPPLEAFEFDYLMVQPSWLSPVVDDGYRPTFPQLTVNYAKCDPDNDPFCNGRGGVFGALEGREGVMTWIDRASISIGLGDPTVWALRPDEDGLLDIRSAVGGNALDDDGIPMRTAEWPCASLSFNATQHRCTTTLSQTFSWTLPWPDAVVGPDAIAHTDTHVRPRPIDQTDPSVPVDTVMVTGPQFVGVLVDDGRGANYGIDIDMTVSPADAELIGLLLTLDGGVYEAPSSLPPAPSPTREGDRQRAWFGERAVASSSAERSLLGVYIPEGVTAEVPRYALDAPQDASFIDVDENPIGGVTLTVAGDVDSLSLDESVVDAALDTALVPGVYLLDRDSSFVETGVHGGVTLFPFGDTFGALPGAAMAFPPDAAAPPQQELLNLPPERQTILPVQNLSLGTPETCTLMFETSEPVFLGDIRITGNGFLDDRTMALYRSEAGATAGTFSAIPLHEPPPPFDQRPFFPDFQAFAETFLPGGTSTPDGCETIVGGSEPLGVVTGSAPSILVDAAALSGTTTAPALTWNGDVAATGQPEPIAVIPVSEGDTFKVEMRYGTVETGDADLYIGLGYQPDNSTYDCRPYDFGSEETCWIDVPAGVSELHVALRGYGASNPYAIAAIVPELIDVRAVAPPQRILYTYAASVPDGEAVLRYDAPPTWNVFDDFINSSFDFTNFFPSSARDIYLSIGAFEPIDYTIGIEVLDSTVVELGTLPVEPGQVIQAVFGMPSGTATLSYRWDTDDEDDYRGCASQDGLVCGGPDGLVVPAGASEINFYLEPGLVAAPDVTVDVTVATVGCSSGRLVPHDQLVVELEPGTYLLALDDGELDLSDGTQIDVGDLVETEVGAVEILGPGLGVSSTGQNLSLNVSGYDPGAPTCNFELSFVQSSSVTSLAFDDERVVAATDEASDDTRTRHLRGWSRNGSPDDGFDIALPPGREARGVHLHANSLWAVTTTAGGFAPRVLALPLEDWPPADDTLQTVVELSSTGQPLTLIDLTFDNDRLLVSGNTSTGFATRVFALDVVDGQRTATLEQSGSFTARPLGTALAGNDAFVWTKGELGPDRLLHVDLRDLTTLYPGGVFEAAALATSGAHVAVAVTDASAEPSSRLLVVDDSGQDLILDELPDRRVHSHLAFAHDDTLISISGEVNGPRRLLVHPLDGGLAIPVASVDAALSPLPGIAPFDPLPASQDALVRARDGVVAIVANPLDAPTLVVVELGADSSGWASAPVVWGPEPLSGAASSLELGPAGVVVEMLGAPAEVRFVDDTNTWQASEPLPSELGRVVGVLGDELVVLEPPRPAYFASDTLASIRVGRVPPALSLVDLMTDADAGFDDAGEPMVAGFETIAHLPSGVYDHQLSNLFVEGDRLFVYDRSASPTALWQTTLGGHGYQVTLGPHRPAIRGTEAVGLNALPQPGPQGIYWIRREASGNRVLRMRR
jgi:hypothetical protein